MSHSIFDMLAAAKRTGGAKDVLTNALIKVHPPSIRHNAGIFFHRKHPGGLESVALLEHGKAVERELEGMRRSGVKAAPAE